jgi:hypothetical protein
MQKPIFYIGLFLVGLFLWARTRTAGSATAGTVDTFDVSKLGTNQGTGLSFGQVGPTLNWTDTRGDALATALAELFGDGQGTFRYVGPDFTLESEKFDVGNRTVLKLLRSEHEYQDAFSRGADIIGLGGSIQGTYFGAQNAQIIGARRPGFDINNPASYIVQ